QAAADREVTAQPGAGGIQGEGFAVVQGEGGPGAGGALAVGAGDGRGVGGSGQGEDQWADGPDLQATEQGLDHGVAGIVADQPVGLPGRGGVGGAGRGDPEVTQAGAAEVLDERLQAGGDDGQRGAGPRRDPFGSPLGLRLGVRFGGTGGRRGGGRVRRRGAGVRGPDPEGVADRAVADGVARTDQGRAFPPQVPHAGGGPADQLPAAGG